LRFLTIAIQLDYKALLNHSSCMKRHVSLIVLTCEIVAIIVLHAVKMSQAQQHTQDVGITIAKAKISAPVVKHYPLLSIK
jgi:hypothetical protein